MATLYFIYAPNDQAFVQRLKDDLQGTHPCLPDDEDNLARADRIIFIRSVASLSNPTCLNALERALERDYRTLHVTWDSGKTWTTNDPTQDEYARSLVRQLETIHWVNFEGYRQSGNERDYADPFGRLREAIGRDTPPYVAFVSYRSIFHPLAVPLVQSLERQFWTTEPEEKRINIWFDRDDIPPGRPWLDVIRTGIEDSHHLVCLVTSEWITSYVCTTEFLHAQKVHKRIISIYLEPLPSLEAAIHTASENMDWRSNEIPEQNIKEQIESVYKALSEPQIDAKAIRLSPDTALHVRSIIADCTEGERVAALQPYIEHLTREIARGLQIADENERIYLVKHTEYLMEARRWWERGQQEEELPRDQALRRLEAWHRDSKRYPPQPNERHQAYLEAARTLRRRINRQIASLVAGGVLFAVLLGVVAVIFQGQQAQLTLQAQEIEAQATLSAETEIRVQTLAQLNRRRLYPVGSPIQGSRPVLDKTSLWVSDEANGVLLEIDLLTGETISDPIPVGSEPRIPVMDGNDVWVSAGGGSTVTRIDTSRRSPPQVFTVSDSPSVPLITLDAAYTMAGAGTLYRLDKATGEVTSFPLPDPNPLTPIVAGEAIWVILPGDQELLRFGTDFTQPQTFALNARPAGAVAVGDDLIVSVGSVLQRFDAQSGQVVAQLAQPGMLGVPIFADGWLWVIAHQARQILQIDPNTFTVTQTFTIDAEPHQVYITDDRLWLPTRSNELISLHRSTGEQVSRIPLVGSNQLDTPVLAGHYLWLTVTQRSAVYVIDKNTGTVFREFSPCEQPVAPLFDGANMWFSCRGEPRIITIPADMTFFETESFIEANQSHIPIEYGGNLWIVQDDPGNIIVFDGQRGVTQLSIGQNMIPLVKAGSYLYTAYGEEGVSGYLVQINPALLGSPEAIRVEPFEGSIHQIEPIEGNIWVTFSNFSNLDDSVNLAVLDQATLQPVNEPLQLGYITMGVERIGADVWVGASQITTAAAYRFDAVTAQQIGEAYDLPGTDFGAWSPVAIGNTAWFTASAPTVRDFVSIVTQQTVPSLLIPMDLGTYEWGEPIELPNLVGVPKWDGQYLWFSLIGMGLVSVREEVTNSSGVLAVDINSGTIYGPWKPCESLTDFYIAGDFVYVGCLEESLMMTIDRRDLNQPPHLYERIGINPNAPLIYDGHVWFSFSESDNAAVFDLETGELKHVFAVGRAPQAPVLYQERVWVYNAGDGSLQRLMLPG